VVSPARRRLRSRNSTSNLGGSSLSTSRRRKEILSTSSSSNSSSGGGGEGNVDKGGKRRSALWVLNCEAEEFLFGETAADKHELELPPSMNMSKSTGGGLVASNLPDCGEIPTKTETPPPKKR
jgi:hypothetical protein